jgi:hypothetical protein
MGSGRFNPGPRCRAKLIPDRPIQDFGHFCGKDGIAAMSTDFSMTDVLSLCVDYTNLASSRSAVDDFVAAVERNEQRDDERRKEQRKPVCADVIAVPLDENRQPCGEAFLALTRNISRGGIAILHTERVTAPYLLLRIETGRHQSIQTVVRVVRARSFYQFTEISGRFELSPEKKRSAPRSRKAKKPAVAR